MRKHAIRATGFVLIAICLFAFLHPVNAQSPLAFRELRQLGRGAIKSISWSPDATKFAVGGSDGIWLYDADKFSPLKQLTSKETDTVRWLPDGTRIAVDGPDGVGIFDVNSGNSVVQFSGQKGLGDWSVDGQQWAFITNDGEINICQPQTSICDTRYTGQKLFSPPGGVVGGYWWLRWSPDGKRIASEIASVLHIWNVETGKTQIIIDDGSGTSVLGWSPDGDWLLTSDEINSVVDVWNTITGKLAYTLPMPDVETYPAYAAWNGDNTEFAILTQDQTYQIWDAATFKLKNTFHAPGWSSGKGLGNWDSATGLGWSSRGILGSTEGTVRLWDAAQGRIVNSLLDYFSMSYKIAWSPVGHRLATAHGYGLAKGDNRLRVWNAATGELICVGEGHSWNVSDVAWSHDGRYIATAGGGDNDGDDPRVIVWQADNCNMVNAYDTGLFGGADSVSWSPDDKRLAIANQVWDVSSGQRLLSLDAYGLLWNPRTNLAASLSEDGKNTLLWDLDTGKQVRTLSNEPTDYDAMAWGRDGLQLAIGDKDAVINIWNATSGKIIQKLQGHEDVINTLAFSPDGKLIAAAGGTLPTYYGQEPSHDNTIRIWDVASGQVVAVLVGHSNSIYNIAWSADGQRIASTSVDGTIRIWEIDWSF